MDDVHRKGKIIAIPLVTQPSNFAKVHKSDYDAIMLQKNVMMSLEEHDALVRSIAVIIDDFVICNSFLEKDGFSICVCCEEMMDYIDDDIECINSNENGSIKQGMEVPRNTSILKWHNNGNNIAMMYKIVAQVVSTYIMCSETNPKEAKLAAKPA
eukprot:5381709-Ditylum_brightwellii.AAC.1